MTVRGGKQIHHHQIGAAQRFIIFAGLGTVAILDAPFSFPRSAPIRAAK
jgi:hypothetical protein